MRVGRGVLETVVEHGEFVLVVEDGYHVAEPVVEDVDNVLYVLLFFETVTDDDLVFIYQTLGMKLLYQVDVEGARGLEVDVVFQCLFHHKAEVAALGTIAVIVCAFVIGLGDGNVEHPLGPLDLRADLGQVGDLERGAVLLDYLHQRNVVEVQFAIFGSEFVLREFEGLVD